MKKEIWLIIILGIVIIIFLGILIFVPAKMVENNHPVGTNGLIITSLSSSDSRISPPLRISGYVTGNGWSGFEGQVGTVKLLDSKGKELASGVLTATSDWTNFPTNFETTLNFQSSSAQSGTLIFYNENPSGLPDKDKEFTMSVKIAKSSGEVIKIEAYFNNNKMDPEISCNKVFAVEREIPKTTAVARVALEQLLTGPTDAEKAQGYFTNIPVGSKLNNILVINGEAQADFNEATESGGGSCSMAARYAQIEKTLMQFSTITSFRLSINGRTGDIFQP